MRKVLSFVLVLSLVLGSLGMAFAAPMSDVAGEDFEDAVNVLAELGVVTGYPDGTYRPEKIVTRAEMAVLIVNALGLGGYVGGTSSFKDMGGHWSNPYVAYATSLGIIDGYTDGTFRPDRTVTYAEAAKMLVAALGFTEDSLVGTWPANYVTKAQALKILDGITASMSNGANRGDIATMLFQTLGCEIGTVTKDGEWKPNVPSETMLSRLGGQDYKPDTLSPGAAFVVLGNEESIMNLKPYQGALVTAYANSKNKIIGIKEVQTEFLTGKFIGGEFGKDKKFKADGKEYDINFDVMTTTGIRGFENGKVKDSVVTTNTAVTQKYTLAVEKSGVKINAVYSMAIWTAEAAFQFEDGMLTAKKLNNYAFTLDDNNKIDLNSFDLVGVSSLDEIAEDNVVYVYRGGSPAEITKVEVGTEVVKGKITKINNDGDVTVNGKVYSAVNSSIPGYSYLTSVDNEVKLYLDVDGDIAFVEKVSGEANKYAIILDWQAGATGAFGKDAKLQLFLEDGTSGTFVADGEAIDDATNYIDEDDLTWGTAVVTGAVIKYSLDENGVVDALTKAGVTSVTTSGGVYRADYEITDKGYMDGYKIAQDAMIFTVKNMTSGAFTASSKAGDYGVSTLDKVLGLANVKAMYAVKDGLINLIVMDDSATKSDDSVYGVFVDKFIVSGTPKYQIDLKVGSDDVKEYKGNLTAHTAATDTGLMLLTFDASGNLSDLTFKGSNWADTSYVTYADSTTGVSITLQNNVATIKLVSGTAVAGGASTKFGSGTTAITSAREDVISLASNVVVYKYDADDGWMVVSVNELKMTDNKTVEVTFYDVYGDDKVADIVTIK